MLDDQNFRKKLSLAGIIFHSYIAYQTNSSHMHKGLDFSPNILNYRNYQLLRNFCELYNRRNFSNFAQN